jgi:signal transduction histidine kinase
MRAAIHEMRNHLCVAMAGVEAFLDGKHEPNDARLRAIFAALSSLNLLIDDLPRDRAVRFAVNAVPIDVCRLVGLHVAAMDGLAARRGVRLHVDGCTEAHSRGRPFLGDPVRIAQIVTNVLMNAIRHTPPHSDVRITYRRWGTNLRFAVSDEGPGVDRSERVRIFEDGYRGRSVSLPPGSGIGLAIVKQFVEHHGGTIGVSNGPLRGATFTIDLPGTPPTKIPSGTIEPSVVAARATVPSVGRRATIPASGDNCVKSTIAR